MSSLISKPTGVISTIIHNARTKKALGFPKAIIKIIIKEVIINEKA
jgi:hypothetical protein